MRSTAQVRRTQRESSSLSVSWVQLLGLASTVELLLLILVGVLLQDTETLVFAAVVGATSVWFLIVPSPIPAVIRCLVFIDVLFFMAPAVLTNARDHENFIAILIPLALGINSATGISATVGYFIQRDDPHAVSKAATGVAAVAIALVVVGLLATAVSGSASAVGPSTHDVILTTQGTKYSTTYIRAPAGQVSVYVSNDDLFWHTFTINKLGVDVRVPVKGHQRVTFTAPRGTYTFYCTIPGHAALGMKGKLTVR